MAIYHMQAKVVSRTSPEGEDVYKRQAYPNVLEMIGQILKKDYYILPSSVHEVIIVPYSEIYVCSKLDEMVREINSTQVEEEDVLSNHVYLYDRVSGKLRVGSSVQTGRMMA